MKKTNSLGKISFKVDVFYLLNNGENILKDLQAGGCKILYMLQELNWKAWIFYVC